MGPMDSIEHDEGYRTCVACGSDCEPALVGDDRLGVRVVFSCPEHGIQTLVDPFNELR